MTPVRLVEGLVAVLPLDNVDTDQLCPARFMKRRRKEGYAIAFLHDLRFHEDGSPRRNPLDTVEDATILLAGRNFGGGSSREAAVYATLDAGFGAVIAESFGDIFSANAARNGLLPARVSGPVCAALHAACGDGATRLSIDLTARTIAAGDAVHGFEIDETRRTMLLNGWDDADITARHQEAIDAFVRLDREARPFAQCVAHPD